MLYSSEGKKPLTGATPPGPRIKKGVIPFGRKSHSLFSPSGEKRGKERKEKAAFSTTRKKKKVGKGEAEYISTKHQNRKGGRRISAFPTIQTKKDVVAEKGPLVTKSQKKKW